MQRDILKILRYFSFFSYAPSIEEIFRFFPKKITWEGLEKKLKILEKGKRISSIVKRHSSTSYTLLEYRIFLAHRLARERISEKKIRRIRLLLQLLSWIPWIRFAALTGTVAMGNARVKDDVDLFIVTARNRLWSGRFASLCLAGILGIRRSRGEKRVRDKACLNLFFDERDLKIPKQKRTLYIAHEVLQMKPIIDKENIFYALLRANKWIFSIFPNAVEMINPNSKVKSQKSKVKLKTKNFIGDIIEALLKKFQLYSINKHKTSERITDTQLWFFPEDFEEKIKREMI